jgi:hypothetical protein
MEDQSDNEDGHSTAVAARIIPLSLELVKAIRNALGHHDTLCANEEIASDLIECLCASALMGPEGSSVFDASMGAQLNPSHFDFVLFDLPLFLNISMLLKMPSTDVLIRMITQSPPLSAHALKCLLPAFLSGHLTQEQRTRILNFVLGLCADAQFAPQIKVCLMHAHHSFLDFFHRSP